jgi:membrane protein DedA with SNARE-associated domain
MFDAAEFFQWFIENANYIFVFVFMMIESSFVPFPSEVVVPPAAYLACSNIGVGSDMNVFMVVLIATLGALAGAMINYGLSLWVGRPIIYKFAESRVGHACLLDPAKVDKAEKYFDKHGAVSTLIGRLIPAVRQLISIPAGLSRMNLGVFSFFTFLGALIWNTILAILGWQLSLHVSQADLFTAVEKYNRYLTYGGYAIAVICVLYIAYHFFKTKQQNN